MLEDIFRHLLQRQQYRELNKHDPILRRPKLALFLYLSMFAAIAALAVWRFASTQPHEDPPHAGSRR
jgi:hypothetical protein